MSVRRHVIVDAQQSVDAPLTGNRVQGTAARYAVNNRKYVRSQDLVQVVQQLDVSNDPQWTQAVMQWVRDYYDAQGGGTIIGLFSTCYLGSPYLDHKMDLLGNIIEHYPSHETPPRPFSSARTLARSAAYEFIEIYDDGTVTPVRADGQPVL
ncbi:hypothetical protein [Nesterenkonia muleiensis]|uniref:hypothetical protein n=1 Tax=Nesterenkonia muleiensis TaxID=2282648 RepID=UPI000E734E7A|nr:hypothetical protein [Nesterenkonia muleiensis]